MRYYPDKINCPTNNLEGSSSQSYWTT